MKYLKNLKFTKIDGTKNDLDKIHVEGFPTLYYFGVGKNQNGVVFPGKFDQETLMKFIKRVMKDDFMTEGDVDAEDL